MPVTTQVRGLYHPWGWIDAGILDSSRQRTRRDEQEQHHHFALRLAWISTDNYLPKCEADFPERDP